MNCIHSNGYSFGILIENKLTVFKNNNTFLLPPKSEYQIKLGNCNDTKCDVIIWIDNIQIGIWRLDSYSYLVIERPIGIDNKLMFTNRNQGSFIKAEFRPEKPKDLNCNFYHMVSNDQNTKKIVLTDQYELNNLATHGAQLNLVSPSCTPQLKSCGAQLDLVRSSCTALGKKSSQQFKRTPSIKNIDHQKITIVYALLV
jgi:hypothetical protein